MSGDTYTHIPVLVREVVQLLNPKEGGRYLDGTLGLGGHAKALLTACAKAELIGLDQDAMALERAQKNLAAFGSSIHFFLKRFSQFKEALEIVGWKVLDGCLLDIGVSSLQLDCAERGFSFLNDGPLDMRMDPNGAVSAKDLLNTLCEEELCNIITRFGEEPQAKRIAKAITRYRLQKPLTTTQELARLCVESYPKAWVRTARHHPATRTFQAIRMVVNDELGELERFLEAILPALAPGGRLVIITFHSLEDRLVKQTMQRWSKDCLCPAFQTTCTCGHKRQVRLVTKKPLVAGEEERVRNTRATSAKVRCVEKLSPLS